MSYQIELVNECNILDIYTGMKSIVINLVQIFV